MAGIDVVEVLVIDDGSTDRTAEVARANGADHIVRFTRRKGLAAGFMAGLDASLRLGADVIVNTDADHQYPGHEIPRLVAPILAGQADMVVGDRGVDEVAHFSWTKRRLQAAGSWVVRKVSGTGVADATSGFRALTREAALRINIVSEFTYTLESIIQAGKKRMAVAHLPIAARETRPSRLISSTWDYVKRSAATILRIYAMYEPFKVFVLTGTLLLTLGVALGLRYAWFWAQGDVVVLMDGDGQHDPADMPRVVEPVGVYDLVIGARAAADQAPVRALGNAVFNGLASWLTGRPIADLTSGFRAARRDRMLE